VPHGPGLEVAGVPVATAQLIGHGCLLVRIGSIKQKPDVMAPGFGSALTCAFDAPVQLRNPLLVLVQVAPGEQYVSAGVHHPHMPVRPAARLRAEYPTWPAEGPECCQAITNRTRQMGAATTSPGDLA